MQIQNAIVYNPASNGTQPPQPPSMLSFLRLLCQRHESAHKFQERTSERTASTTSHGIVHTLRFAEAFLEKNLLNQRYPRQAVHIAIVGPTQAGKSSVINWLLDKTVADVSPLAGYTVHPQGFMVDANPSPPEGLETYFRNYRQYHHEQLNHARIDGYTLDDIALPPESGLPSNSVFWDTPDFDSIDAHEYQDAVRRAAALADALIVVVSKDKYADLSVWKLLDLIEPLAQPTIILLNKTDPGSEETLVRSIREKWNNNRKDTPPPIICLPYLTGAMGISGLTVERQKMCQHLDALPAADTRRNHAKGVKAFIDRHWIEWTQPLAREHQLQQTWEQQVETAVDEALERYQRDYLDHPNHYETFQLALAQLLSLLEVPGLGGVLVTARRAVTWPLRQLGRLGRNLSRREQVNGNESAVLHQLAQHILLGIREELLLNPGDGPIEERWRKNLGSLIPRLGPELLHEFDTAVCDYMTGFQPEIESAASSLYKHLQQHPVTLNTLRATRVTTDASMIALALHTGGIGVQDLVIAPAMVSVTSLLAESALGRYMNRVAENLKQRQKAAVEKLFRQSLQASLARIASDNPPEGWLEIPPETLAAAENLRRSLL